MASYATLTVDDVLAHARKRGWLVEDGDIFDSMELRAQVASGDYFITLATQLDKLRETLESDNALAADQLDTIITDLLYLQRNYSIQRTI